VVAITEKINEIERRLEAGEDVRKEFWRLAGEVKRSRIREDDVINRLSRIRDRLFEKETVIGFREGFALFSILFLLFNFLFFHASLKMENGAVKAITILGIEIGIVYTSFLVGRCIGSLISRIGVDGFYRYSNLEFGVKMNYRDYLKAEPVNRVILFSGAIFLEHLILAIHLIFLLTINSYWIIPAFILIINLPFSYLIHRIARTGELHRLLRELRIFREIKRTHE